MTARRDLLPCHATVEVPSAPFALKLSILLKKWLPPDRNGTRHASSALTVTSYWTGMLKYSKTLYYQFSLFLCSSALQWLNMKENFIVNHVTKEDLD